jgi:hypothetical protein
MQMLCGGSSNLKPTLVLAVAIFLVLILVLSPVASAVKDPDKTKNGKDNDGRPSEKDNSDDGRDKKNEGKKNKNDKEQMENDIPAADNLDQGLTEPSDNSLDLTDNNFVDQPENVQELPVDNLPLQSDFQEDNFQNQPQDVEQEDLENDVVSDPEQPSSQPEQPSSQPEQPSSQPEQPSNDANNQVQLEILSEQSQEEQEGPENDIQYDLPLPEVHEELSSLENQVINPDAFAFLETENDQVLEPSSSNDQDNLQSIQVGAQTVPGSGTASVSLYSLEEFLALSFGFGAVFLGRLAQIKVQQKFFFQIQRFQVSISDQFGTAHKRLEKFYLVHLRFGKIKCRSGFTKEEALAFFRECQGISFSWNSSY